MDKIRDGNFTSSQIYRLMGSSKVMTTYIKEKNRERRLKASINVPTTSHSLSWGQVMQNYVFRAHLDLSYKLELDKPKVHGSGKYLGSEDVVSIDCVGDIKCPYTRTSFCDLVEVIETKNIELFKQEYPEYYWQLVSLSDILGKQFAELIVWMPYENEFDAIMGFIENIDDFELQRDIQWFINTPIERLPFLPNDCGYSNINRFKFEVPKEDIVLLNERVKIAYELLNEVS